jgi:PAS domain S-box-containing protein
MSEYINNYSQRQQRLKGVIRALHEGKTVDDVKGEFAALLRDVGATEVAEIEQTLIAEGLPEMEVKRLCDVHVAVFRESLDAQPPPEALPGHPVHTMRAENEAAEGVLDAFQEAVEAVQATPDAKALQEARRRLRALREYDRHYLRKENMLFPYLERHGFAGPSSVMWAIHDDIRAGWKALEQLLSEGPRRDSASFAARVGQGFEPLATAMREMFYKEENILFPTAIQKLSAEEWTAIRAQESEIGYAYVEPGEEWGVQAAFVQAVPAQAVPAQAAPAQASVPSAAGEAEGVAEGEALLHLDTGVLTAQQVNLMLTHLPVEISYVDQDDTVRYFSQGPERIFVRSPAVIGRRVQKCHPPSSVHRVQQILDGFRAGQQDRAEFWIQRQGKFIYIRYFAMRDSKGEYQGTLEVVQDVTGIRKLEGERRLLDNTE